MKREDVALAHAALDVALGTALSNSESELVEGHPFDPESAATVAGLLYYHLDNARRLRMQLDDGRRWDLGYENLYRQRVLSISHADRHYRTLLALNYPFDPHLARLVLSEGLTP